MKTIRLLPAAALLSLAAMSALLWLAADLGVADARLDWTQATEPLRVYATGEVGAVLDAAVAGDPVAAGLLRVVREAAAGGTDAETALRAALTRLVDAVDPVGAADPDAVDPDAVDLVAETRGAAGRSRPGEGGG